MRHCEFGPPPYTVADVQPGHALILASRDATNGQWTSTWQMVLSLAPDGSTRLLLRSGKVALNLFDLFLGPGFFVMQRRMLEGFKERAEGSIGPWITHDSELLFWLIAFAVFLVTVALLAFGRTLRIAVPAAVAVAAIVFLVAAAPPVSVDALVILALATALIWALRPVPVKASLSDAPVA